MKVLIQNCHFIRKALFSITQKDLTINCAFQYLIAFFVTFLSVYQLSYVLAWHDRKCQKETSTALDQKQGLQKY